MHFQLKTWFHGVGLELADSPLFERALIHSSYVAEHPEHPELRDNRRLEFVGRPLLLTAISLLLQDHLTDQTYETLESVRNTLASDAMLAEVGRRHHLGKALLISTELAYEGGRDRDQVLAQGVAAVSTAVYVQGGMPALEKLPASDGIGGAPQSHVVPGADQPEGRAAPAHPEAAASCSQLPGDRKLGCATSPSV